MNIHEYQAKAVLGEFGAPVSRGKPAFTPAEAEAAAKELPGPVFVVKSQIHAGGRGKGKFKEKEAGAQGGVRLAKSVEEVKRFATEMLGRTLVTAQTGPAGKQVGRLYVEDGSNIAREFYLSMLVDRKTSRVAFVVSTEGGMDIEKVAHETPDKIVSFSIDPATGAMPFHGHKAAEALGLTGDLAKQAGKLVAQLYAAFVAKDMSLLEINPLVVTTGNVWSPRRQGRLRRQRPLPPPGHRGLARHERGGRQGDRGLEIRPVLHRARRQHRLHGQRRRPGHGDHGHHQALRRGAGQLPRRRRRRHQGEGDGGLQDHHRRSEGEGHPRQHLRRHHEVRHHRRGRGRGGEGGGPKVPLVVRLEGTNVDQGKAILKKSGLNVIAADDLDDAAKKIVDGVKGVKT